MAGHRHPLYPISAQADGTLIDNRLQRKCPVYTNAQGYHIIVVSCEGKKKHRTVHRLVYECFHGQAPPRHHIDHIDNNKTNNAVCNLQALTSADHNRKTYAANPLSRQKSGRTRGRKVVAIAPDGTKTVYDSTGEAAKLCKLDQGTISKVANGMRPAHKGYQFKYVEELANPGESWVQLDDPNVQVSNMGRIMFNNKRVSIGYDSGGYKKIRSGNRGWFVHRLVCLAFNGEALPAKDTVDHINRDRLDNRAVNLRWADRREQSANRGPFKKRKAAELTGKLEIEPSKAQPQSINSRSCNSDPFCAIVAS